jgi:alpha-glucosidase
MPDDEHYYGLGDKAGTLDRRDMAFANWNTDAYAWQESTDPLYKTIPFFVGLRKGRAHGIFVDNTWRSWFDFGKTSRDAYSFGSDGGELDYYFINGPDPKAVVQRYSDLTGKTPLPPLWSLGFQQCRYSYYPEKRATRSRGPSAKEKIPADVIYLDIDYQGQPPLHRRSGALPELREDDRRPRQGRLRSSPCGPPPREGGRLKPYDEGAAGSHFVHAADRSVYFGKVWRATALPTSPGLRAPGGALYEDFVKRAWPGSGMT